MKSVLLTFALLTVSVAEVGAVGFPTTVTAGVGLTFNSGPNDVADFNLLDAAGGKFIRQDCYWRIIEPQKGVYNFTLYDWLARQCGYRDMHRTMTLCYSNSLYGDDHSTQAWRDGFTNFAVAVAANYAGQDNIFEIWNEPNGGWTSDYLKVPSTYMALVKQAAPAMRAVDPTCKILGPSLSDLKTVNDTWLHNCIDQGLLNYVDAISVHPYRATNPESAVADYATIRTLMQQHGKVLPLVCTEWGYSTGTTTGTAKVPDAQTQADYLARIYLVNASEGILFTTAFLWKDTGTDPNDYESNFGTVKKDLTPKPAYYEMQTLISSLSGTTFTAKLPSPIPAWQFWMKPENDWLLEFTSPNGAKTLAAWTTGNPRTLNVPGWGSIHVTNTPQYINPVPEPGTLTLLGCGLLGVLGYVWRKRQ